MGGHNPFLKSQGTPKPTKPYTITFLPGGTRIEVDPTKVPYSRDGLPGSILEIALAHGVEIDHACGGVCACSTCHVIVKEGYETIPAASEDEEDQLDNARGLKPTSRLACQAVPNGARDVVVEIPSWNRNLVSE
ncbi:MAG: 2Fe-2S iron-sulfur cluster binding domain-containing protein [Planctomycetes bacterium]|nr:2Fe-2S iron-sulfur cluster binding domain-containing protein [Planctomycetota bacterium]